MTSVKAYLYERAVSPLLGSLIVSWCAWNYKFLLLWVSGLSFPDKLRYVHVLYSSVYEIYLQGMLLPFLTSMAYIFLFPYPAKWVYQFSLKRQKVLNDLKNEVQENELLSLEQSKVIRNQLADAERLSDEQIERKDRAIEARDRQIEELQLLLNEKSKDNHGQETDSNEAQQELLDTIRSLQKKVADLENDDSIFRVNHRPNAPEFSNDSGDSSDTQLKAETTTQQRPDYITFYEELDWVEKSTVEHIISIVQDSSPNLDELQPQILNVSPDNEIVNNPSSLKKLLSKMKAFDIIGVNYSSLGGYYELSENGKPLYRYILGRNKDNKH